VDIPTVKAQLDTTLILFDEVSETIGRLEDRLIDLEVKISNLDTKTPVQSDPNALSSIHNDAADLRALLISLRQQLEKSFVADIEPMTSTLKSLHHEGIPQLVKQVSELKDTVTAFQQAIPMLKDSVNAVIANVAPMNKDTEAAGHFARSFQLPMQELLGRNDAGVYQEGNFVLRNMARLIFSWSGSHDAQGKGKENGQDRIESFLNTFFEKNYLHKDGTKMKRWEEIGESFLDYIGKNIWHRVFDAILLALIWALLLNPAAQALKEIKSGTLKQLALPIEQQTQPRK
jgi:chromosome segregation ATPase